MVLAGWKYAEFAHDQAAVCSVSGSGCYVNALAALTGAQPARNKSAAADLMVLNCTAADLLLLLQ
jgi:hypothetical protein